MQSVMYPECHKSAFMLSVIMLNAVTQSVAVLNETLFIQVKFELRYRV